MLSKRSLLFAVAVLAGAGTLTSCEPPPPKFYGTHGDYTWEGEFRKMVAGIEAEQALGSDISRNTLRWNEVERTNGTYSWAFTDSVVNTLRGHDMEVVLTIFQVPRWANGTSASDPDNFRTIPSDTTGFNAFKAQFVQFVSAAAERYKDRVKFWEIWNEPNEFHYWKPRNLNLANSADRARWIDMYAQLYTAARAAIRDVDSTLSVAVGGVAGIGAGCCISGPDFIRGLIDRGVVFNDIAVNPHAGRQQAPWQTIQFERSFSDIKIVRDLLVSRGKSNVGIWVTEFGWDSGAYISNSTRTQLRAGGNQYRLALWPNQGQVVVNGVTRNYSSINRTGGNVITLTNPLLTTPPNGTEIYSPTAEQTHKTYVREAFKMLRGTYEPVNGRPNQNYSYVELATYFVSYDRQPFNSGIFRTPKPDFSDPGNWTIPKKPAADGFAAAIS